MKNKNLYFNIVFYILCGVVFGFGLQDFDNLLVRNELNIHTLIIQWTRSPAWLLMFFNIVAMSFVLRIIFYKHKLLYLLIIFNPFVILNVLDAYNRFVFTIAALYFFDVISKDKLYRIPFLSLLALSIHPFNAPANYYRFLSSIKVIIFSSCLFLVLVLIAPMIHDILLEYSTKYQLFIKLGGDVASQYEGNMVILKQYASLNYEDVLVRTIAFIFPYGFLEDRTYLVFLLSLYNLLLLSLTACFIKPNSLFVCGVIYILISALVGNFAVVERHFLPILIFFILITERKVRFKFEKFHF